MRYSFTDTYKRFDGRSVYKTTFYPVISDDPSDIYIVACDVDFLDSLAKKYYGDESLWWVIANANNLGKGRLSIPIGKQLRIPGNISDILNKFRDLN